MPVYCKITCEKTASPPKLVSVARIKLGVFQVSSLPRTFTINR